MKLFGKALFAKKKVPTLYDFAQHNYDININEYIQFVVPESESTSNARSPKKKKAAPEISPKELYTLGTLNQPSMQIMGTKEYVTTEQTKLAKKLLLIKGEGSQATYARQELTSMIERLGNRLKLKQFEDLVKEYPHTTTAAIQDVVKAHSNLRFSEASGFISDMPDDAVAAMDNYRDMCQKLCGKDPVFYVLADKKDFGEVARRRDPILFAQSPYGFFWQILGAWDEEMIYLGDL